MKKRYWQWFCLLLCGIMVLAGCDTEQTEESERAERSLFAMNTYMTFTAYGEEAGAALDAALKRVEEVEALWSVTDENSEIYRANHNDGRPITVSAETADLVAFALEMAERTEGALDLGAVGKGYTADLVTEILREHGVTSAIMSLGGNIQAIGSRPDGDDTSFEGIKETAARMHLHVRPFLVRFFRGLGDSPFEERMTMLYPGGQGIA